MSFYDHEVPPSITIITPVLNRRELLKDTINSVIMQQGINEFFLLKHIIIDGGSTDGTQQVINNFTNKYAELGIELCFIEEPDNGMYDAIAKGLELSQPGLIAFQNAGDFYHPGAFLSVIQAQNTFPQSWYYGKFVRYDSNGACIQVSTPLPYRHDMAEAGFYGFRKPGLRFFQQESLFFHSQLLADFQVNEFRKLKLAGDFFIFLYLIQKMPGIYVDVILSGFRLHKNHLSEDLERYREEMSSLICAPSLKDWFVFWVERVKSLLPNTAKIRFHSKCVTFG